MSTIREKLREALGIIIIMTLFGGCFYLIYVYREKDKPTKNKNWCSEIIYYNPHSRLMDTNYCSTVMYQDSIVDFKSPTGKIWYAKDFINQEDKGVDYGYQSDITVSNGEHFKITPISDTVCLITSKMDSLKDENDKSNDDDNN